jgi:hypothetical protein
VLGVAVGALEDTNAGSRFHIVLPPESAIAFRVARNAMKSAAIEIYLLALII